MKLSLRRGAPHAPSALSPFAAHVVLFRAWLRESMTARLLAIALGLAVLAILGDSALARGDATSTPSLTPAPALTPPPSLTLTPTAPPAPLPSPDAGPSNRASPDSPVDLNAAKTDDLRRLPGVGPKRAEAILAVRARLGGRFRQIEDLLKVKGIGRAMLRRLRPLVRLDAAGSPPDAGA